VLCRAVLHDCLTKPYCQWSSLPSTPPLNLFFESFSCISFFFFICYGDSDGLGSCDRPDRRSQVAHLRWSSLTLTQRERWRGCPDPWRLSWTVKSPEVLILPHRRVLTCPSQPLRLNLVPTTPRASLDSGSLVEGG